ncbi:hypothetical protein P154DRAFT_257761 [Amniculicola lignicola CBS 123094]|uniref:Uncharacterized protein n=1 Tax=Amniculicola lignicola CBS 123094 TaxID=1392246 RepID=A0A6A5X104_9PLEO|nr:hypothetical protein P154DRAFT_257761 [Amniculicola lignicola CBS 123094]
MVRLGECIKVMMARRAWHGAEHPPPFSSLQSRCLVLQRSVGRLPHPNIHNTTRLHSSLASSCSALAPRPPSGPEGERLQKKCILLPSLLPRSEPTNSPLPTPGGVGRKTSTRNTVRACPNQEKATTKPQNPPLELLGGALLEPKGPEGSALFPLVTGALGFLLDRWKRELQDAGALERIGLRLSNG